MNKAKTAVIVAYFLIDTATLPLYFHLGTFYIIAINASIVQISRERSIGEKGAALHERFGFRSLLPMDSMEFTLKHRNPSANANAPLLQLKPFIPLCHFHQMGKRREKDCAHFVAVHLYKPMISFSPYLQRLNERN
ncbi:hypothetical protein [Paenibacillus sp. Leaf72]|uniref:hypothetical protein n=1 Tax=Paenibacillus sp. Leaf72 TaxID=1736234 RepID=UPI0006F20649|nr:hypothetical protein [Paenibacillus sp. Leaf72]KQN97655.1 hypothetical protein ASF12_20840 [Paenibacillus sp. Leaf72]